MSILDEHLKTRLEEQKALSGKAEATKQEWLEELDKLLADIDKWLESSKKLGLVVKESIIEKSEELLGIYKAPQRVIEFGGRTVHITPVGRGIVGAQGRVDIRAPGAIYYLLLNEGEWSIMKWSQAPVKFSKAKFEEILTSLL